MKSDPIPISDREFSIGCAGSFILTVIIVYLVVTVLHRPFSILLAIGVFCIAFACAGLIIRIKHRLQSDHTTDSDTDSRHEETETHYCDTASQYGDTAPQYGDPDSSQSDHFTHYQDLTNPDEDHPTPLPKERKQTSEG